MTFIPRMRMNLFALVLGYVLLLVVSSFELTYAVNINELVGSGANENVFVELGASLGGQHRIRNQNLDRLEAGNNLGFNLPQLTAALERRLKLDDAQAIQAKTQAQPAQTPGNNQATPQSRLAMYAHIAGLVQDPDIMRMNDEKSKLYLGKSASEYEKEWNLVTERTKSLVDAYQRAIETVDPSPDRLALDPEALDKVLVQASVAAFQTNTNTTSPSNPTNGSSLIEAHKEKKVPKSSPMPPPPKAHFKYPWMKPNHTPWCYDKCAITTRNPWFYWQRKVDLPYGLMEHGQFISYVYGEDRIPKSEYDFYKEKAAANADGAGGAGGAGGKKFGLGGLLRRAKSKLKSMGKKLFGGAKGGSGAAGGASAGPTKTRTELEPPYFSPKQKGKEAFGTKRKRYRCFTCDLRMDQEKNDQGMNEMTRKSVEETRTIQVTESLAYQALGQNELKRLLDRIPPSVQLSPVMGPKKKAPGPPPPRQMESYIRNIVRSSKPMMSFKLCMNEQSAPFASAMAAALKPMYGWVANCY